MAQTYMPDPTRTSIKEETEFGAFFQTPVTAPTNDLALDVLYRRERHTVRGEVHKLRDMHRIVFRQQLEKYKQACKTRTVINLLDDLESNWGMAWVDVARMVGVSVPALRKWRVGASGTTTENHERLAGIVAFFEVLKKGGLEDPVSWLAMPLFDEYSATPRHLYSETREAPIALLDFAAGTITPLEVLDELVPEWRTKFFSEYVAVSAGDGLMSLVNRASL